MNANHGVNIVQGTAVAVDPAGGRVTIQNSAGSFQDLVYDHLVLACGSVTNFFGMPGLAERALTMKSLGDAIALRNRLIEKLEEADFECAGGSREHLLSVVVAGGGFAGVETIAAINDFLREALRFYPHLHEEHLRLVLVHSGEVILPELGPRLGAYAQRKLAARGVEIRTRTRVRGVSSGAVDLTDGTRVPADTLVWTAGTSPNPLLDTLDLRRERGRVIVDERLRVPERPEVWAVGDCASVPDRRSGGVHPPTAQHALRQGRVLARNLAAAVRGGELRPFDFRTLGQLAAIGRRTGVARVLGVNFSGFLAWCLWRSIYLSKLPRFEKKLRVALDWTLDVLFSKDLVQFQTLRSSSVSHDLVQAAAGASSEPILAEMEQA